MLFKKPRYNYCFIGGLVVVNFIFRNWLDSMNPSEMIYQGPPPAIVQSLATIVTVIIGVYLGLYLAITTYSNLGPKLKRTRHNLCVYGIKSSAALAIILGDLATLLATERNFYNNVFHSVNNLSPLQEFFILFGFPILGVFLIWNLRNQKIEFEEPSPVKS